jgi:hypothetical protein
VVAEETIILSAHTSATAVAEEAEVLLRTVDETLAQVVEVLVATPEMVVMAH